MAKLILTKDNTTEKELEARAKKMKPSGPPSALTSVERAIHFLQGVNSRAGFALSNFYLFLGSTQKDTIKCSIDGYPGQVLTHSLAFSSINTISLACRKVFDHKTNGPNLTGSSFAKTSDETLKEVASYWSKRSNRLESGAITALLLLRDLFFEFSKTESQLLDVSKSSILGHRIGVLKQHANREAAHLSLESYEFEIRDCAHVVAALCLLGEIVRSFDKPDADPAYYNELDVGAHSAAKSIFPEMSDIRLFQEIEVESQARLCWQCGIERGKQMFHEQLPHSMGW